MPESITMSATLPASPQRIYEAWLDSGEHSAFTDSKATIDSKVGGTFTAWDGYIQGANQALEPGKRIVQSWRTTDFPDGAPDSRLELLLEPTPRGARVTLLHTNIPDGQAADYKQGWKDYYFAPMKKYFAPQKKKGPA